MKRLQESKRDQLAPCTAVIVHWISCVSSALRKIIARLHYLQTYDLQTAIFGLILGVGPKPEKPIGLPPMKVLVVDDSGVIRCVIARVLKDLGIRRILEANDGSEAWDLLRDNEVGLVITDWHMPRIDGLELTKKIRAEYPELPIVMVSIVDTREMIIEIIKAGVNEYVCKPFTRDELSEKIEKYLPAYDEVEFS